MDVDDVGFVDGSAIPNGDDHFNALSSLWTTKFGLSETELIVKLLSGVYVGLPLL